MNTKPIKEFNAGELTVKVFENREQMGQAAAAGMYAKISELMQEQEELRMIFAAAPSQNDTLNALKKHAVEWNRIAAFHMDEYVGIDGEAPQAFGKFLKDAIFDAKDFKSVDLINSKAADLDEECKRYGQLIDAKPIDVCALGIGENGHLAFNDPPVADFKDPLSCKVVELDKICRQQQVNDGCFSAFDLVPEKAFTLTIPALLQSKYLFLSVPGATKANAVYKTINDPIGTECPSTILRNYPNAIMYLDKDSAAKII